MLEFIFMKIRPPPKTSVNHMGESLATGHLKSQDTKVDWEIFPFIWRGAKLGGDKYLFPLSKYEKIERNKGGGQFTQVLRWTEINFWFQSISISANFNFGFCYAWVNAAIFKKKILAQAEFVFNVAFMGTFPSADDEGALPHKKKNVALSYAIIYK